MNRVTVEKTQDYLVVKIPLRALGTGRVKPSPHTTKIIETAIHAGLRDIDAGRSFGPFKSTREFKKALRDLR